MRTLVISNAAYAAGHLAQPDIETPSIAYEKPERLEAVLSALRNPLFLNPCDFATAPEASNGELENAHPKSYVDRLSLTAREAFEKGQQVPFGEEFTLSPNSWLALVTAAGSGPEAVRRIRAGSARHVICAVRPPGHHADPDAAMGFCGFSNAAIGAIEAAKAGMRVVALDFDIHHGNGTKHAFMAIEDFATRERLMFVDPCIRGADETGKCNEYPNSSTYSYEPIPENIVQIELPPGTSGDEYLRVFDAHSMPRIIGHEPDLIVFSTGFDCLAGDPIGGFELLPSHLYLLTRKLLRLNVPTISFLEGGYDLDKLFDGMTAHAKALELGADSSRTNCRAERDVL